MEKADVDKRLAEIGKDRKWLAEQAGYDYRTLVNALAPKAKELSFAMQQRLSIVLEDVTMKSSESVGSQLVLKPSPEEWQRWQKEFKASPFETLEDWVIDKLSQDAIAAGFLPDEPEILRYEVPLLRAAAGSPTLTDAEVTPHPHPLGTGRYLLELVGDSMQPTFQHKQRIIIRSKDSLKRPLLKKGELYHFIIDGKTLFKRYNTRRATPQEIASGTSYTALDGSQKVKILESLNPAHPPITLTEPIEWLGWYDAEDNQLNGVVHP